MWDNKAQMWEKQGKFGKSPFTQQAFRTAHSDLGPSLTTISRAQRAPGPAPKVFSAKLIFCNFIWNAAEIINFNTFIQHPRARQRAKTEQNQELKELFSLLLALIRKHPLSNEKHCF